MVYDGIATDIILVKELIGCTTAELASTVGIGSATLERWMSGSSKPSASKVEAFYDYAYSQGLRLSQIKAQLRQEHLGECGQTALFHGSKAGIDGALELEKSKPGGDFGKGFYCTEAFEQAAAFVADWPSPSVYFAGFNPEGLARRVFSVDEDWMLTVAWFRGALKDYADHPRITALRESVAHADYIVAPIADNRTFEVMGEFFDGEITNLQCLHSLSATDLGSQYVFVSAKALASVHLVEKCLLAPLEKRDYIEQRRARIKTEVDKGKVARRQFRGQGAYVEELLS